jgi:hypothetical protein
MTRQKVDLDAGVAAILGESQQRQERRSMTAKERYDAERVKASYDCPRWLREAVKQAASQRGTSASQLAAFLLVWGLAELKRGNDELRDLLWRSRQARPDALRIEYDVEIPDSLHRVISPNGTD